MEEITSYLQIVIFQSLTVLMKTSRREKTFLPSDNKILYMKRSNKEYLIKRGNKFFPNSIRVTHKLKNKKL